MQVLDKGISLVLENSFVAILLIVGVVGIFLALLFACLLKSESLYFAITIPLVSFALLFLVCRESDWQVCLFCISFLSTVAGVVYLLLFFIFLCKKRRLKRKEERVQTLRKIEYALPNNEYVRSRLQTVFEGEREDVEKRACKLSYARKLLSRVKDAPLTVAERLETEELGKTLALFTQKDRWTTLDMKIANELFSRILKLSGKYAI